MKPNEAELAVWASGKQIQAIRMIVDRTHCGLLEGKEAFSEVDVSNLPAHCLVRVASVISYGSLGFVPEAPVTLMRVGGRQIEITIKEV